MVAFAANSLLCRRALGDGQIDPASFTSIRVLSGAVTLLLLIVLRSERLRLAPDWRAVLALSAYMAFFSFAYLTLSAGTGALLLFGAVQLTMFAVALRSGERFRLQAWVGLLLAVSGLIMLVAPGVTAPSPAGASMMLIAGIAWGVYSLIGRGVGDPLSATASNFVYSVPIVVCLSAVFLAEVSISAHGVVLAVASGALASGVGYAIWYSALRGLSAGRAATVQLSVPVIAALGGVLLLSEQLSSRLVIASVLTIGGIWLVLVQRARVR